MQSENDHTKWLQEETGEAAQEAYRFFMRPDPNQREFLGSIEEEDDPLTGMRARFRMAKIGMVRNAADDDKKEVKVYLGFNDKTYLPHIRIDNAKPLQGWYQDRDNAKQGSRPRPCFSEAILTEPYGGYCTVGCAFSLVAGELIDTPNGLRAIEDIRPGDRVWGRTQEGRVSAFVEASTSHAKPEGYVNLKLTDGRLLKLTADHPVYASGRWTEAGSLLPNEVLEDINEVEALSGLRGAYSEVAEGLRQLRARNSFGQRGAQSRASYGPSRLSEVGDNAPADERGRFTSSGRHGAPSVWTKVAGMVRRACGGRALRDQWVSALEAFGLDGRTGENLSHAFSMGGLDGAMAGWSWVHLGVRTGGHSASFGGSVPAGLPLVGRQAAGGQGVLLTQGSGEAGGGSFDGVPGAPAQRARVASVERVPGALTVYDIQTSTRNFYHSGVLVHNCYVNSGFRGYRGTGLISVPIHYGQQVGKMLSKTRSSAAGYFSSFTDPFLPIEEVYHNTQQGAEEFVKLGLPIFFLSRLSYPGWAIDLLLQNKFSYAQKSLNTGNDADWQKLSPGAIPLQDHIDEIKELRSRGIYTSIQVNPIVPGIVSHDDIRHLFERLAAVGNNHVIVKFVEAGHSWSGVMVERLMKRFGPERGGAFAALFTENQAGSQKTIAQAYRLEAHALYQKWATELGMTYATCYEYARTGDDKVWKSIGREYTTADQCHGHKVPMFSRENVTDSFTEVKECAPTGCLYCAPDLDAKKAPCGSELFGSAKALRSPDFKHAIGPGTGKPRRVIDIVQG